MAKLDLTKLSKKARENRPDDNDKENDLALKNETRVETKKTLTIAERVMQLNQKKKVEKETPSLTINTDLPSNSSSISSTPDTAYSKTFDHDSPVSPASSTATEMSEGDFSPLASEFEKDVEKVSSMAVKPHEEKPYVERFTELQTSASSQLSSREKEYQGQSDIQSSHDKTTQNSGNLDKEIVSTVVADRAVGALNLAGMVTKGIHDTVDKAEFLMRGPQAWLEAVQKIPELVHKGQTVAEVIVTTGTVAVAAPLVVKSIVTGWHDFQNGKHTVEDLKKKIPELEKKLYDLEQVSNLLPGNMVTEAKAKGETQLREMKTFLQQAKNNKKIGVAEMFSGSAILAKSTIAATSKIASVAAANSGASATTMGAVGTLATTAGVANMVLGPLVGTAVAYAGIKKYRSSDAKLKYLTDTVPETSAFLEEAVKKDPTLREYKENIETKLNHRIEYYKSNKHWNLHLAASGVMFGGISAGSGAVAVATLAGVGALVSNPVGAGIVAAGVSTASIYMAASAAYNIINAPKQELYDKAMQGNASGINKDFLSSLDSLALLKPDSIDELLGVQTRAMISESQAKCNEIVQDLLHDNGTGKPYRDLYIHSTDSAEVIEKRMVQDASSGASITSGNNLLVRQTRTNWSASSTAGRFQKPFVTLANLHQGKEIATQKGKDAYAKSATYLTKTAYGNHLKDSATDNSKLFKALGEIMAVQASGYEVIVKSAFQALPVSLDLLSHDLGKELASSYLKSEKQLSEEMREKIGLALKVYESAAETGDKHIKEHLTKYLALRELSEKFKDFSEGEKKSTDMEKAHAIEAYMALRQDEFPKEQKEDPKLEKSFDNLASFLLEEEPKIYRLQKATMPLVETYTTNLRQATTKTLDLQNAVENEISHLPESAADLKAELVKCYEKNVNNIGSDEKRKDALLEKFNTANDKRRAENKPIFSAEEFVNHEYGDRIAKKATGKKTNVVNETINKALGKKSRLH